MNVTAMRIRAVTALGGALAMHAAAVAALMFAASEVVPVLDADGFELVEIAPDEPAPAAPEQTAPPPPPPPPAEIKPVPPPRKTVMVAKEPPHATFVAPPAPELAPQDVPPPIEPPEAQPEQQAVVEPTVQDVEKREAPQEVALAAAPASHHRAEETYSPPRTDADYLNNPKPRYPALARRRGIQGVVLLEVAVAATGETQSVNVKSSSGNRLLDLAALEAVEAWRFVPASKAGQAVEATVEVPIRFILEN